jgi:invasion protein IalB
MDYVLNIEEPVKPNYGFLVDYKFAKFMLHLMAFMYLVQSVHAQNNPSDASRGPHNLKIQSWRYSDWTYQCLLPTKHTENVAEPKCDISQSVQAKQNGTNIELFNITLIRANDKSEKVEWALVILIPIGLSIHLPSDFGLIVGKRKPFLTRFRNCNAQGCQVLIPADNSLLNNLKHANNGAGLFRMLNGKVIRVEFSLKGFTKAFNALASGNPVTEQPEDVSG